MRITERRLRRIIRRTILESTGHIPDDAQRIVMNLSRHQVISSLMGSGMMKKMVYSGVVQEIIRNEVESYCSADGEDHCAAVQKAVENMLSKS